MSEIKQDQELKDMLDEMRQGALDEGRHGALDEARRAIELSLSIARRTKKSLAATANTGSAGTAAAKYVDGQVDTLEAALEWFPQPDDAEAIAAAAAAARKRW